MGIYQEKLLLDWTYVYSTPDFKGIIKILSCMKQWDESRVDSGALEAYHYADGEKAFPETWTTC